jgi:DNA repair exonuclease SbcCD ATPase subunit
VIEIAEAALDWVIPAVVVFGATAVLVVVTVWAGRRARAGAHARARAEDERTRAGTTLVELDDAVAELDLEVGLSGALYGGDGAAPLRRARMLAQHARDRAFDDYRRAADPATPVPEARRIARRVREQAQRALTEVQAARRAHASWVAGHASAADQLAAVERRWHELHNRIGDPRALLRELERRVDPDESRDVADAVAAIEHSISESRRQIDAARALVADPSRTALPAIAAAERALRAAADAERRLEESHRLVMQASEAFAGEIDSAREAIRGALRLREGVADEQAEALARAIRTADEELSRISSIGARRPVAAVDAVARLRTRLDLALGDVRTAQQRMRGARTALPGALASARASLARAEADLAASGAGAEARVRVADARDALAHARIVGDPVEALDAARRALRHADDARALCAYARLGRQGGGSAPGRPPR